MYNVTWTEHPRLQKQKADRINLLAKIQYENGWSREEMYQHFRDEADGKTQETDTSIVVQGSTETWSHWHQIGKQLTNNGEISLKSLIANSGRMD